MRRVGHERFSAFAVGLVTLIVIVIGTYFGFTKANPFAKHFEIKAAFKNASNVKPKSPVRIAGINVGKVSKVESLGDGSTGAIVTMQIDDKGLPVHKDAKAKVRPRIFLEGNYFVDLQPGSPSEPSLNDGDMIEVTQTASPVGLGQVLEALQSDTREDLRTLLQEYGKGLSKGGARGYARSIPYQEPAFRDSALVNDATRGILEHDLSNYIKGAGAVAAALDRDPAALKSLITDFAATADAFASQEANLQRAVGILDETLATGRTALGNLNLAFPPLRRLVAELRPATRSSGPSLDATLPLVKQLRRLVAPSELGGLVKDLRPVVPDLVKLNEGGVALQEQTRLLSSCQNTVILPTANAKIQDAAFPATGKVAEEGVKWLPGIAGESRSFDANGQYVKTFAQSANYAYAVDTDRFIFTTLPLQGVNPPKAPGIPEFHADVPCETQQPPDLRTIPSAPPPAIKIDRSSAAVQAGEAKARARAVRWLRRQLRYEGLDKQFRVTDRPLTRDQLGQVGR